MKQWLSSNRGGGREVGRLVDEVLQMSVVKRLQVFDARTFVRSHFAHSRFLLSLEHVGNQSLEISCVEFLEVTALFIHENKKLASSAAQLVEGVRLLRLLTY